MLCGTMDDFARLTLAIAGQIYQRGKDAGAEAERARVLGALAPPDGSLRRLCSERYGRVSPPVLRAIHDLALGSPSGVSAKEVLSHLEMRGTPLNSTQVRAAMKYLVLSGDLWRPSPGRYLPREAVPQTGPMELREGSNTDPSPNPDLPVAQPCGHRGREG